MGPAPGLGSALTLDRVAALGQAIARAQASQYGNFVAQAQGCLFEQATAGGRVRRVAVPLGRLPFALPRVAWRRGAAFGPTGPAAMRAATMALAAGGSGTGDAVGVVRVSCVVPRAVSAAAFAQLVRAGGTSGPAAAYYRDRAAQIATRLARAAVVNRVPSTAVSPAAARIRRELLGVTAAVRHEQRRAVLLSRPAAALPLLRADVAALAGAALLPGVRVPGRAVLGAGRLAQRGGPGSPGRAAARALSRATLPGGAGVRPTCEEDPGDPGDDGTRVRGGASQAMDRAGGTRRTRVAIGARPACGGGGDPPDPPDPPPPDGPSPPDSGTTPAPPDSNIAPAPPDSAPAPPDSSITPSDSSSNPVQDCNNAGGCTCDDLGDCDSDWDYYDQLSIDCGNGVSILGIVHIAADGSAAFTQAAQADSDEFSPLPSDLADDADAASRIGCAQSSGRNQCLQAGEAVYDGKVQNIMKELMDSSRATASDPFQQLEYGAWLYRRADGSIYRGQLYQGERDWVCLFKGRAGAKNNQGVGGNGLPCDGSAPPGAIGFIHTHPSDGDPTRPDEENATGTRLTALIATPTTLHHFNPNIMTGFADRAELVNLLRTKQISGVDGSGSKACE